MQNFHRCSRNRPIHGEEHDRVLERMQIVWQLWHCKMRCVANVAKVLRIGSILLCRREGAEIEVAPMPTRQVTSKWHTCLSKRRWMSSPTHFTSNSGRVLERHSWTNGVRCTAPLSQTTGANYPSRQVLATVVVNHHLCGISFVWCQSAHRIVLHQAESIAAISFRHQAPRVGRRSSRFAQDLVVSQKPYLAHVLAL